MEPQLKPAKPEGPANPQDRTSCTVVLDATLVAVSRVHDSERETRRLTVLRAACAIVALVLLGVHLAPEARAQFREPDIEIELDQFGFGGSFRPGELAPMRLRLTNNPAGTLSDPVSAWVQWEVPNADGDIYGYGRPLALTRGRPMPVWLWAPLPPDTRSDTVWTVRVFEYRDGQRRGEIGGRRVRPADFNARAESLGIGKIAILGQRRLGLDQLTAPRELTDRPLASHEDTRIIAGLRPENIPDRWYPLISCEAIVWSEASPQGLTSDTAAALREYVRRGGHLVVVLPEDTNPWQFGGRAQTALADVLPQREPRRDAAVSVSELLPILSKRQHIQEDRNFTLGVRVFKQIDHNRGSEPFDVIDPPYEPLIALPDGRVVAIQRTFGHGRITIVGVPLAEGRLASIGLPQADVFWNRVLGRRADTPTGAELAALREEGTLVRSRGGNEREIGARGLISGAVAEVAQAGFGLMLALLLFTAYWVLAGPGGFGLLKLYKRSHHAWIAFAAAAGVFTAIAWGSVGLLRINQGLNEPSIKHLTFLDHVARPDGSIREEDPQLQRAVTWLSLYTPHYGTVPVSIASEPGQRDVLIPWTPPDEVGRFPNADRATVNISQSMSDLVIPSRSTSTLLYGHWIGGVDPDWGGMIRSVAGAPVDVRIDATGREERLIGQLTHNLAGPLRNVTVIWVRGQRLPPRHYDVREGEEVPWVPKLRSGQMLNAGYMWASPEWGPGEVLDFADQRFNPVGTAVLSTSLTQRYIEEHRRSTATGAIGDLERRSALEMLSFFHQLTPPEYFKHRPEDTEPTHVYFHRRLGRELDLSTWFARPCLIVIGFLRDSDLPVPVRVGDSERKPRSDGLTVVRWIYPLPLLEEIAFPGPEEEPDAW